MAFNYESYVFKKLRFIFETQAPTSKTGSVILTVDYDNDDPAPVDKTQAMAYRNAVRCAPWQCCEFNSAPEDIRKRSSYFTRNGVVPFGQDYNLYDVGQLNVCTQGQADAAIIGELYVDYDIHFMTPQLGNIPVGASVYAVSGPGTSNVLPFSPVVGNLPLSTSSTGTTTSVTTFTFAQPWEGVLAVLLVGTGITSVTQASANMSIAEQKEVIDATGANAIAVYTMTANVGSTFTLTIANTTLTSCLGIFGQGDF